MRRILYWSRSCFITTQRWLYITTHGLCTRDTKQHRTRLFFSVVTAIVFGVTKFREYLFWRHFKLLTDHKPLITLLGENKPVPQWAPDRIKRWSLLLAAYDYTIEFISRKDIVCADFLSRKRINRRPSSQEKVIVNLVTQETKNDPALRDVLHYTNSGCPEKPRRTVPTLLRQKNWNSPMRMEYRIKHRPQSV